MRLKSTVHRQGAGDDPVQGSDDARSLLPAGDPRVDPLVVAAFRNDAVVAHIRAIRAKVIAASGEQTGMNTRIALTAIVGVSPGDAPSVLSANLATVFAQMGTVTGLVDAGLADPAIASLLRVPEAPGLADSLRTPDATIAAQRTAIPGLFVLPAGSDAASQASHLERGALVDQVEHWSMPGVRQIIVALPAMGDRVLALGNVLAGFDNVVIVAEKHRTKIADIRRIVDVLDQRGIPVAGSVLV